MQTNDITRQIAELSPEKRALLALRLKKSGARLGSFPLSFAQERFWFIDQLEPGNISYNTPEAWRLSGPLNVAALEQALNEITRRHEILRTNFLVFDGTPMQVVNPPRPVPLEIIDLRSLPASGREAEAARLAVEEGRRPFDLARGALVRTTLLKLADDEHIVLRTEHHIINDGLSREIFLREIAALYEAYSHGRPSPLAELPIQYADYAVWQRQWLQGERLDAQLAYWQRQLGGTLPVLDLPTDRPRPAVQSWRGAVGARVLTKQLADQLVALGHEEGASLFMTLLAAFKALLQRYTNEADLCVGTPILNRDRAETESLMGYLGNTLVLRTDAGGDPTFRELLRRVRKVALEAYAHQDVPFERVVRAAQPERSLSRSPLFQVMFTLQSTTDTKARTLPGLILTPLYVDFGTTHFDLTLSMELSGDDFGMLLQYDTDLFDADIIKQILEHMERLLVSVVENPDRHLSDIALLSTAEQQRTLVEWNDTKVNYPQANCIHQLFEQQAARTPDAIALAYEAEQLTYRDLDERANQLAHYLRTHGVGPESLVGLCAERSIEMVVALLGILKAGGAYVPLDPEYPEARLAFMLAEAQVSVLLTQQRTAARLADQTAHVVCLDTDWSSIATHSTAPLASGVGFDNLAYVIYTSGSTGRPKGAMNTHGAIYNRLVWMQATYKLTSADRVLQKTPYSFDVSVWEFFWPLMTGARLVMARPGGHRDTNYLMHTIRAEQITTLHFVPSMLQMFLDEDAASACRSLQRVFCSGEALAPELQARFFTLLDAELHNLYGPTEAAVDVTYWHCQRDTDQSFVPIGQPVANTQMYILDERLRPIVRGGIGELYIGGVQLARGYLRRPDLTADKFIPNPFGQPGARLYKTGDLARHLPDGQIKFIGRADQQVKLRGARIELGEIEAALAQAAGIREAAVIIREDVPGDKRLTAYLIVQQDAAPTHEQLRSFLKTKLPDYMIPAAFVLLPAFPLTPSGKLDRRALPAPDGARPELRAPFVAPRTATEQTLAAIWAEVLRVARVGAHDSFFDLGGDSILSIQVIARANRAGLKLLPKHLFQHQTVAELASVADAATEAGVTAEQGLVTGPVMLTPIQHWFFEQQFTDPQHFNQALMLEVRQQIDQTLLSEVVAHLLDQHDALRLRFTTHDGQWQQVNDGADTRDVFTYTDLAQLTAAEQRAAIETRAAELQASLDLTRGPMLRVALFDLGRERGNRLLLVVHHLVVDGVSWRILLDDLERAYTQRARGEQIALGPKTTSYQEWARLLARHAQADACASELAYWTAAEGIETRALPVDKVGGANAVASERSISFALSADETRVLLRDARATYQAQVDELLLAALVQAVTRWTGDARLLVDLEAHGREHVVEGVDLSRTVGWFTTLFPVVFDSAANIGATLRGVKEQLRAVPQRGLGYGALRYLRAGTADTANLRALPQAQVVFNYLGRLDAALDAASNFAPAPESAGHARSPRNRRTHLLDVSGSVAGEQLRVVLSYSEDVHERATIEALANRFGASLRELIAQHAATAPSVCTPADFPLATLNEQQLSKLLKRHEQVEDIYALSPLQQGILFHSLYEVGTGVYLTELTCELRGALDVAAFARSWQQVVARHSVLRTCFEWDGLDEPVQIVRRNVRVELEEQDWRADQMTEPKQRFAAYLHTLRAQGTQLDEAPLMRLTLIRSGEDSYLFAWHCHHLLLDGWSVPLLVQEVFGLYDAARRGQELALPSARPFKDYIAWLHEQPAPAAEQYWRTTLAGFDAPTPLRVDKSTAATRQSATYAEEQLLLAPDETSRLQAAARRYHVTMNTLVQGAWALLLSRYSGEPDVVFGVTSSGRPPALAGIERMVGMFINTLPARVRVAPETPVAAWLAQLQRQQAEQREFEHSTLAQVQEWSELPRGTALFESILIYENYPAYSPGQQLDGQLEVHDVNTAGQTNYPLTVLAKGTTELLLKLWYDCGRFSADTMTRMLAHLRRLLDELAAEPNRALGHIELLSVAERRQLLEEWNATPAAWPVSGSLQHVFEARAAETPEAVAVVLGTERLSYAELNRRANQLAHHLRALGVGPDVMVGICVERSIEMMVGLLGILKAGGAYVPLDPAYPQERLAFMLADAQIPVLLTQQHMLPALPQTAARLVCLDADWDVIAQSATHNPAPLINSDNLAYVIYTSGSTGQPKGVPVTHGNVLRLFAATDAWFNFDRNDTWTLFHSYAFDFSVWELWGALLYGGRLVVVPHLVSRAPAAFHALLCAEQVTVLNQTPSAFRQLVQVEEAGAADGQLNLRLVIFGGEALELQSLRPWFARHGDARPQLVNMYGITETTVHVTYRPLTADDVTHNAGSVIGRAIPDLQLFILDERQQPVPIGVPGELHVGGAGLARGYLGRPDLTAERFIANPFTRVPGARLYRSGDLARYLPNGDIEYLGRRDSQVKIRGFRIEVGEIEATLNEHAAVRESVVLVQEHELGEQRLVAYVVAADRAAAAPNELRGYLKEKLPEYMIPAAFVAVERVPLTTNGKVDRRALLALATSTQLSSAVYVAPQTQTEEIVAGIWAEVFRLERVSRTDNFFDLGGHSLLTTRIVSRIREACGVELPLSSLFETNTLAELAAQVDSAAHAGDSGPVTQIASVRRDDSLPLSFAQQRLWFLDQLEPNSAFYNIPVAVRLQGQLNLPVLEQTLNEIVRRHEVLRTTFTLDAGRPVQRIQSELFLPLQVIDLSELPPSAREPEALRLATNEAQQPFDLAHGPLLRVGLLRLADDEHVALITMHHIVSDGWSTGVFVREVAALYEAFVSGAQSPLAELPIQYADYASWQREWLQGGVLDEQLGYWRTQLGGELTALELPTDKPRPAVQTYKGASQSFQLPVELSAAVKELSRRESVTPFMTLLAAFQVLLHRYTGQDDICVGTPVAGRNRAEVEHLIGFFVNTLVMRTNLAGAPSFRALLARVREMAVAAYAHQDVPFEKLVEELQPERELSRNPLFQVMFEIQNQEQETLTLPGLSLKPVEVSDATAKFDLTLLVAETDAGLTARFEYNIDLFDATTITRMGRHFEQLLANLIADPTCSVAAVPLLAEDELRQLLVRWNSTATPYPHEQCAQQLFAAQAARTPDRLAAVCDGEQLTYAELNRRANRLAHHLRALGVGPEVPVAVFMERQLDLLVALLAILKAGGVYVPLDPNYPKERLAYILTDARAAVLLTRAQFTDALPEHDANTVCLDTDPALAAVCAETNPPCALSPANLAYVIYTSGSTGRPKGAMVTHAGMLNHLAAKIKDLQLCYKDNVAQTASQSFDISIWQFLAALLIGGQVEIFPDEVAYQPARLFARTAEARVTILETVPALLRSALDEQAINPRELSGLRWLLVTGEALPPESCRRWLTVCPNIPLLNAYGPTECSDDVAHYKLAAPPGAEVLRMPVGRPVANTQLYVLDRGLRPVPVGVAGELCVGGVGVGRGYLRQPALTAEKFVPDPFAATTGARLYRTGDLARYLPDGNIEFLGRLDQQVKVRGFRIELGEIEALLGAHEAVRDALVLVSDDEHGAERLLAFVVKADASPTSDELRGYLKGTLPDYMIPAGFIMLDALPLTPNGKVDRRALLQLDVVDQRPVSVYEPPRTPVEEAIAEIWAELLDRERIGAHDNFFDLGGHSLLAIQVLTRLHKTFKVDLPLRSIFEAATVATLAERLLAQESKPGQIEKIALVLRKIRNMSAADKQRVLQQKRNVEETRYEA